MPSNAELIHRRHFTQHCETRRGTFSAGKRGLPSRYLPDVRCSEVWPLDSTAQQEVFARGVSVDMQIWTNPADIVPEDIIVIENNEVESFYTVVEVAPYPVTNPRFLHIYLRVYQEPVT